LRGFRRIAREELWSAALAALTNSILAAFEMSLSSAIPFWQSLPTAFKKTV
jgi:hypothetical protein